MNFLSLTMIGVLADVARSNNQEVILADQASMMQLQVQKEAGEPKQSETNTKWSLQFQALSKNLTAECAALDWTTQTDCKKARDVMDSIVQIPTRQEEVKFLEIAQSMSGLQLFVHTPDQYSFAAMDMDGDGSFTKDAFMLLAGPALIPAVGLNGCETLYQRFDGDGSGNATRQEVYDMIRGALVIRHFIPELDAVQHDRAKDGTAMLTDSKAMNMALHIIDPPALPREKLNKWTKLACVFGIMVGAMLIQWFFCFTRPKEINDIDESSEKEKTVG